MSLRPVVRFPDPMLRQPTAEVSAIDDATRTLVADMIETMYAKNGAGLAAIQVGAPVKLFIVEASIAGGDANDLPIVFINPKIEWLSDEQETSDEGCLSFPGIYVPVKRALKARVRAIGLDGNEFVAEGEGLYARAMQHENDHLDNRLLIDFVGPIKRQMIKRKLERMTEEEAAELQGVGE
ncbi:MAG TPA: peptide deformylase [Polyangia bacterium]|nr:peptide deformylase [Polyangia bacterium]